MKFNELTWSWMSLHAVPFFVWAAHKNFAVLVDYHMYFRRVGFVVKRRVQKIPMIPLEVKSLGRVSLSLMTSGQSRRLRAPELGLRTILTRGQINIKYIVYWRFLLSKMLLELNSWGCSPSKNTFNLWECVLTLVGVQFSKWLGLCSPLKDRALCCTMGKLSKKNQSLQDC